MWSICFSVSFCTICKERLSMMHVRPLAVIFGNFFFSFTSKNIQCPSDHIDANRIFLNEFPFLLIFFFNFVRIYDTTGMCHSTQNQQFKSQIHKKVTVLLLSLCVAHIFFFPLRYEIVWSYRITLYITTIKSCKIYIPLF